MQIQCALREKISEWTKIGANETVKQWINCGARIPLTNNPSEFFIPNRKFQRWEAEYIDQELSKLIDSGAIKQVQSKPTCVSPINLVAKKNKKFRLVVDLRRLNEHINNPYIKNEGIDTAASHIQYGDKCVTFDLKDGYHHIPVATEDQTYLGIYWRGNYYVWQVYPFGLSSSGYFFNKTIREVVKYLRGLGVRTTVFVDGGLVTASSSEITDQTDLVIHTFEDLGFSINYNKSMLQPSNTVEWLGYIINTTGPDQTPWITIPPGRIQKLRHDIRRAIRTSRIKARYLARIAGQCISMCKAILPAKLKLRNIYKILRTKTSWQDDLTLDEAARLDLEWWSVALSDWNGAPLRTKPFDVQITTDASGIGLGASFEGREASGVWDKYTSQKPSNYRELLAIILAILSFKANLKNKKVQVLTDNISCVAYINRLGGISPELSKLAQALWDITYEHGMELSAKHLAGRLNVTADELNRRVSSVEWMLHPNLFQLIDKCFGPHDIDRFASLRTAQIPQYNSLFWDPCCEAVDAMAQDWSLTNNFINAPFRMIGPIIDKIQTEDATATIIAPRWPAQQWYKKLQQMASRAPIPIPNNEHAIIKMSGTPEPLRNRKWKLYAWKICGKKH